MTGLHGTGLVLQNNGGDDLAVAADAAVTFTSPVSSGASYSVTVRSQPSAMPAETCAVSGGSGVVGNAPVTGVTVTCRRLTGRFVFVADTGSKDIHGFSIDRDTGGLTEIQGSPFPVDGGAPRLLTVDPSGKFLYVTGADSLGVNGTLTGYAVDAASGALTEIPGMPLSFAFDVFAPAFDSDGKYLYVSVSSPGASADNRLHAYSIDAATGALTEVAGSPYGLPFDEPLRGPAVDAVGGFLYVPAAQYEIAAYTIDGSTGSLTSVGITKNFGVYASEIDIHPSGKFLYTRKGGVFAIDPGTGALTPTAATGVEFGAGAAFGLEGTVAYFAIYGSSNPTSMPGPGSVAAFTIDPASGALSPLPGSPYPTGGDTAVAITMDPTQGYVAATNFGSGTVAIFAVDASDGSLTPAANSPFAPKVGTAPGAVTFDPSGQFVYLTDAPDGAPGSVSAYRFDASQGTLTFVGSSAVGSSPSEFPRVVGLQ